MKGPNGLFYIFLFEGRLLYIYKVDFSEEMIFVQSLYDNFIFHTHIIFLFSLIFSLYVVLDQ